LKKKSLEHGNHGSGAAGFIPQARSPRHGQEPGDVCRRGWQRAHHGAAHRQHHPPPPGFGFNLQITLWLWFTVLFANFAEAMAEGRGKAQADTLRKAKGETIAKRYTADEPAWKRSPAPCCAWAT
jgi:hypothetical protein